MGFGAIAWLMGLDEELAPAPWKLLAKACWSVRDQDPVWLLRRSRAWLAKQATVSERALYGHLAELHDRWLLYVLKHPGRQDEFVVIGAGRKREAAIAYIAEISTTPAESAAHPSKIRHSDRQNLPHPSRGLNTGDFDFSLFRSGDRPESRLSTTAASGRLPVRGEVLERIWGAIASVGRREPSADLRADVWDDLRLVRVDSHSLVVACAFDVDPPAEEFLKREITRAAQQSQMLRGRRVEIVVRT